VKVWLVVGRTQLLQAFRGVLVEAIHRLRVGFHITWIAWTRCGHARKAIGEGLGEDQGLDWEGSRDVIEPTIRDSLIAIEEPLVGQRPKVLRVMDDGALALAVLERKQLVLYAWR
jgi:hypothetical protein